MSTRHLVDPEIWPILELIPIGEMNAETLPLARGSMGHMGEQPPPVLAPMEQFAKGRDGAPDVRLLVYNPASDNRSRSAILQIHGGGMILGSADMSLNFYPPIAVENDLVVVAVDYRLAPETTFPGPQEDCYAALTWLVANAETLGVDPAKITVMGESAGGGLAAALTHMVRDRGEYSLAAQILIYPMLDHRTGGPDCQYNNPTTGEFLWTKGSNQFGWSCLKGEYAAQDARKGWFSPALADDVSGLPPAFIPAGALDLFVDESLDYARRLNAAGVPVEVHIYPGAFHGFNMLPGTRLSEQAMRDTLAAIKRLTA